MTITEVQISSESVTHAINKSDPQTVDLVVQTI